VATFVYAYPDGQEPLFWVADEWVMSWPGNERRYMVLKDNWHPYPKGGEAELRAHQGYVYAYPTADKPSYYLREVNR